MRWLAPLLLAGCAVDTAGLGAHAGAPDASVDARAWDASLPDVPGLRDGGTSDATVVLDAFDECTVATVLLAEDFEGGATLDARDWTPTVELSPFAVRLTDAAADGPGSDGGRYLLFETTDSSTSTAESGSATSSWVAFPSCEGGAVHVSVRAVAGDIDFVRDGEAFDVTLESREAGVLGSISFADQDDRNIGRPDALLGGHRLLAATDWIAYDQSWSVPAGTTEVRVSVRSWITHWDDFGGIDELLVSFVPMPR